MIRGSVIPVWDDETDCRPLTLDGSGVSIGIGEGVRGDGDVDEAIANAKCEGRREGRKSPLRID